MRISQSVFCEIQTYVCEGDTDTISQKYSCASSLVVSSNLTNKSTTKCTIVGIPESEGDFSLINSELFVISTCSSPQKRIPLVKKGDVDSPTLMQDDYMSAVTADGLAAATVGFEAKLFSVSTRYGTSFREGEFHILWQMSQLASRAVYLSVHWWLRGRSYHATLPLSPRTLLARLCYRVCDRGHLGLIIEMLMKGQPMPAAASIVPIEANVPKTFGHMTCVLLTSGQRNELAQ